MGWGDASETEMRTMKIRLRSDDGTDDWVAYEGIRNTAKLKQFVLTDHLTAFVYSRVSHRFHSTTDDNDDKRREEFREMSVRIARSLALDYLGTNEGTPADQVSRRVVNMVAAMEGREQEKATPATLVTREQLESTKAFMSGKGPQTSVRMSREMASSMGLGAHASIHDVTTEIVQMLVDSRDEMRMQSVMRLQYDSMRRILGDLKKVPDDLAISCTRMYLALRCVLQSEMQSLGDVMEPSFDCDSLMEVVPRMLPGPAMESPVIITIGRHPPDSPRDCRRRPDVPTAHRCSIASGTRWTSAYNCTRQGWPAGTEAAQSSW